MITNHVSVKEARKSTELLQKGGTNAVQQSLDRATNEAYIIGTKDTSSLMRNTIVIEVLAMSLTLEGQPESSAEQVIPELLRDEDLRGKIALPLPRL